MNLGHERAARLSTFPVAVRIGLSARENTYAFRLQDKRFLKLAPVTDANRISVLTDKKSSPKSGKTVSIKNRINRNQLEPLDHDSSSN
jgi:hypothetical protein